VTTRLHPEFLSQVLKQQEDSAMTLASTKHYRRENIETKNRRLHTIGRKNRQKIDKRKKTNKDQVGFTVVQKGEQLICCDLV
jgi:hypothetical protein